MDSDAIKREPPEFDEDGIPFPGDITFIPGTGPVGTKMQWRYSHSQPPERKKAGHIWYQVLTPPNSFHRLMQRIIFGIIWEKLP